MDGSDDRDRDTVGSSRTAHPASFREDDVVGRYRILRRVGAGGMGVVYEAEDPELGRSVALKLLLGVDDRATHRFVAEARGQARVEHPAICRVYEAGELQGLRHIAMRFVDGQTIDVAREQMTLREKVDVLRQVCEGIHAAHRLGLIHRDLKPSNILVARGDDGGWQPFVTDFGLVKDLQAASQGWTEDGVPMGSPAYMSPEQARGETDAIDRRSDVYALGATLYDVLSGAPPYVGTTAVDLILQAVRGEAAPLRDRLPTVPADLDAIVMKCLEKEPRARYPSARALGEDLDRFLAGDVVQARPTGLATRLWRRAMRHRALVTVGAVAAAAVVALSGTGLHARWQAHRQAEVAQQLGQEVKDIEWRMHIAHLCPVHDLTGERAEVARRVDALEARVAAAGTYAEGPGAYAVGRGALALGEPDRAAEHLREAWDGGYQTRDVARALGLALGEIYERERDRLVAIQDLELRATREEQLQREYRDPALAYLATAGGRDDPESRYLEALMAHYDGRHGEAIELARDDRGLPASQYQSTLLLGRTLADLGAEAHDRGDRDEAAERFVEAQQALDRAAAIGRSDPAVHLDRADLALRWMVLDEARGVPTEDHYRTAREACETALAIDPGSVEAHLSLARVLRLAAYHGALHGSDRLALFEEALGAADATIALDPTLADAHFNRGEVLSRIGQQQENRQEDPRPTLREAVVSLERALELDPSHAGAHGRLAMTHQIIGEYEASLGLEPFDSYEAAAAALERGLAVHPERATYHSQLGAVLSRHALALGHDDPRQEELFRRASAAWDRAMELNPSTPRLHLQMGLGRMMQGMSLLEVGGDPLPDFDAGIAALERSIELKPDYIYPHTNLALALTYRADYRLQQGHDSRADLDRAIELCDRAAEINPDYPAAPNNRGLALVVRARHEMLFGEDPEPGLADAEEAAQEALLLSPSYVYAEGVVAFAEMYRADVQLHRGQSPQAALGRARDAMQRLYERKPAELQVLEGLALLELLAARAAADGASAGRALDRAEQFCDRALELDGHCYWAHLARAQAAYQRAAALAPADEGRAEQVATGLDRVAFCLERRPDDSRAQILRGALLLLDGRGRAGDVAEGRAAVDAAVAANPTLRWDWGDLLGEDTP